MSEEQHWRSITTRTSTGCHHVVQASMRSCSYTDLELRIRGQFTLNLDGHTHLRSIRVNHVVNICRSTHRRGP
jgi:hypothetical protein